MRANLSYSSVLKLTSNLSERETRMFKDLHAVFGLVVGSVVTTLGAILLNLSPAGWSLAAVGLAITGVSILMAQNKTAENTALIPALIHQQAHSNKHEK